MYPSGKTRCYQDEGDCKSFAKSTSHSLFEMRFHTPVSFGIYDYAKYIGFQKFGIRNCCVCRNYVDSYNGLGKICRLYRHLQIPPYETLDTSMAKTCRCFIVDKDDMEQKLNGSVPASYDIL